MVKIVLFCGGRGSASIIREILRIPEAQLSLLVNAYDNGSSTGELRRYIPGYLGPSDFRKNLSYLLELYSPQQYTLSKLLDYRLPKNFNDADFQKFMGYVNDPSSKEGVPQELIQYLESISGDLRLKLDNYLINFYQYYKSQENNPFNFQDCSFGNFIFAGAFLKNGNDFARATQELMMVFQSKTNARLINITQGENRFLVGLKDSGEVLDDEAQIVSNQSAAKFSGIYLIPQPLTAQDIQSLAKMDLAGKKKFLENKDSSVELSPAAQEVIEKADIIVFGPGTQFSSLFPSYKTKNLGKVIASSQARAKVFVMNLTKDHDIASYTAEDVLDAALDLLGDKQNKEKLITHVLFNEGDRKDSVVLRPENNQAAEYKNIKIARGNYGHSIYSGIHNGRKTVRAIVDLYHSARKVFRNELDVYVDLNERSVAAHLLVEEFLEIDWKEYFSSVRLIVNKIDAKAFKLPEYIKVEEAPRQGLFPEVEVFKDWFWNRRSKYLVTITGDGEYRMTEILNSIRILENSSFGAVYGSRNQSRQQFLNSLHAAYGESRLLFHLSRLGAMFLSLLFTLRFRILLSDPLTGFRVYNRSVLEESLSAIPPQKDFKTPLTLTRYLANHHIEIAEIPVRYRTFRGFTNVKWRLSRGWKNLMGIIS